MEGRDDAPPLLAGTGKDQTHLLVVCTAERGLVRRLQLARSPSSPASMPTAARARARRSRSSRVGKKGNDILKRLYGRYIIDHVDLRAARTLALHAMRRGIAQKVLKLFDEGQFDVCTLFFAEFKSVMSQKPTALQLIPASVDGRQDARSGRRHL